MTGVPRADNTINQLPVSASWMTAYLYYPALMKHPRANRSAADLGKGPVRSGSYPATKQSLSLTVPQLSCQGSKVQSLRQAFAIKCLRSQARRVSLIGDPSADFGYFKDSNIQILQLHHRFMKAERPSPPSVRASRPLCTLTSLLAYCSQRTLPFLEYSGYPKGPSHSTSCHSAICPCQATQI